MGMVAPPQGIASAYVVFFGVYGDVTRQSLKRNVSRQTLYREAAQTSALLQGAAQCAHVERLQEQVQQLQQRVVSLESDLSQAVVIGDECMARLAAEAQAEGVSLPTVQGWLQRLLPGRAPSVAKLGVGPTKRPLTSARCCRCWTNWRERGPSKWRPTRST